VLFEQHEAGINAQKFWPFHSPWSLRRVGNAFYNLARESLVDKQVQLEVDMSAVPGNTFACVCGATHRRECFAAFHLPGQSSDRPRIFFQVRVEPNKLPAVEVMSQHDIVA